jgi:hypothetical protein
MIIQFYSNLYKKIFIAFYKSWKSDIPEWNAAILFPLMIILNLIFLSVLLGLPKYVSKLADLRIVILCLYVGLIVLNYFCFIRTKKYKDFEKKFNQLDKLSQRREYRIGILISLMGYCIPIIAIILIVRFF